MTEPGRTDVVHDVLDREYVAQLDLRGDEVLLDLGCGRGQLTELIGERVCRVVAVDASAAAIAEARETIPHCDFRVGRSGVLPLTEDEYGSFDVVHARFLLEAVPNPVATLREALAVLRPGGRLMLADDDHDALRLWPEVPGFAELWREYSRYFDATVGDAIAGRKLAEWLTLAGAELVSTRSLSFGCCSSDSTFSRACDRLRSMLEELAHRWNLDEQALQSVLEKLESFAKHEGASIWHVLRMAEGRRKLDA